MKQMKIKKLFKSIREVINNIPKILEGIVNSIVHQDDVERTASIRFNICKGCPHIDNEGKECLVPGSQPCCSLCGCSLEFKTRSLSSECPDGRWHALMTEEEEEELNK